MANTYCDYYSSVGATAYATYHGCVEEPVVDPPMMDVCPTSSSVRIDQGATWRCDFRWVVCSSDLVQTEVDLEGYEIDAMFYLVWGEPFQSKSNVLRAESQFRLELSAEETDAIEFSACSNFRDVIIDVYARRTGATDVVTGYATGEVARVTSMVVRAYRRGAGE